MVFQKVASILAELIEAEEEDITPATPLSIASGIDALCAAKLIIQCEKKFNITIYDEDVHTFKCVHDIVDYIETVLSDA